MPQQRGRALDARLEHRLCRTTRQDQARAPVRHDARSYRATVPSWEAGASPLTRSMHCVPIDGGHTNSSRECHSIAGVRWRHGWSTASMGRHGKIASVLRLGVTLGSMKRQCRAREASTSPQARSRHCGPIDGGHTRSLRECHSSAGVCWTYRWSTGSVGRHGKIESAHRYGATLGSIRQRC